MTTLSWGSGGRGFRRLESLTAAGYQIREIHSDETLVGVRLMHEEHDDVTVALTREDFAALFPRFAPKGSGVSDIVSP